MYINLFLHLKPVQFRSSIIFMHLILPHVDTFIYHLKPVHSFFNNLHAFKKTIVINIIRISFITFSYNCPPTKTKVIVMRAKVEYWLKVDEATAPDGAETGFVSSSVGSSVGVGAIEASSALVKSFPSSRLHSPVRETLTPAP